MIKKDNKKQWFDELLQVEDWFLVSMFNGI